MLDEKAKWQTEQYNNLLNIETDLTVLLQKVEAMRKKLTPNQPQKKKRLSQKERGLIAANKRLESRDRAAAKRSLKNN